MGVHLPRMPLYGRRGCLCTAAEDALYGLLRVSGSFIEATASGQACASAFRLIAEQWDRASLMEGGLQGNFRPLLLHQCAVLARSPAGSP